jgi:glycosyltransferase involved in cell wall biosynthesis
MDDTKPPRPRVLLLAYYCSPQRGSEEAIGWNRALASAEHCDTWVITRDAENTSEIAEYLQANGEIPGLHFVFVPSPVLEQRLFNNRWLQWFAFRQWHRRAFAAARRLHDEVHFDLVHQVTCLTFREPGQLWKLDVPFIWGPVGGTDNYPWRFLLEGGPAGAVTEALRNFINSAQLRWSRRTKLAARRANATGGLLVASSAIQGQMQRSYGVSGKLMSDAGIRRVSDSPSKPRNTSGQLRILWSGQFLPRKALSLLLRAVAELPGEVEYEVRVLGDGPMQLRWKRLSRHLGIDAHVKWMGWLPYQDAQKQNEWADVFAFTSLRDTTGQVILEALANGLPVICLDHQGAHDVVNERCGIRIPVVNRRQVVADLKNVIARLAQDPSARADMSAAAIDRAREYLWMRSGTEIFAVYRRVVQRQADARAFGVASESRIGRDGLDIGSHCPVRLDDLSPDGLTGLIGTSTLGSNDLSQS